MDRIGFIKKLLRYMLLMLLGGIAIALGNRIVTGNNCSSCPGSGICKGKSDCSIFLSDTNGEK